MENMSDTRLSNKETLLDDLLDEFMKTVISTLKFRNYTMTKMKEKSLEWNNKGVQLMQKISDEELKNELAYRFANVMIDQSLKFSNEYPYLVPEIEERFIRKAISKQE